LVTAVLERAQALSTVYLLTKTAGPFFRHLGFGSLGRDQTPAALQRAPELAAETCSSARLMWRPLRAAQGPGAPLTAGSVHRDPLGVHVLAHLRDGGEPQVVLGPRERALLAEMPWPLRRSEWLAGRRVAKQLLHAALDFAPERVEVLPLESGAPAVWVDGAVREGLTLSLSHTRTYAVAAVASHPVGVDVCDDVDGARLPNIAQRVLSDGEAEECDAHRTAQTQAAVWALKEAGLKLRIGGVFEPGARSVRVTCLEPAAVADPTMRVTLLRLPLGAVALAVEQG
jgi:phosphopantetheinyl transferase